MERKDTANSVRKKVTPQKNASYWKSIKKVKAAQTRINEVNNSNNESSETPQKN